MRIFLFFCLLTLAQFCKAQSPTHALPSQNFTANQINRNPVTLPCNNWLSTPIQSSYVDFGDLDIPGNQITVEAVFNRTQPYVPGEANLNEGDIVSKHYDPSNVNYLLRPNHAYVTTSNGFFIAGDGCEFELNKTYHVAMVYNGSTLKFYRNGFLMNSVPATGNLIQNNFPGRIGMYDGAITENLLGFINEVRIWSVARTQAQIKANMTSPLPSPTIQTGLQAYFVFDNLLNKQGNAAWNGTLGGSAAINATNTSCNFIADSCAIVVNPTPYTVINQYTPVVSLDICKNIIHVTDASKFNIGDTVLLIQMQGAVVDSTNTAAFGTITDYKNAGNYEFNYIKSKTGNAIELLNATTRKYDIPNGKVQLIRVPYFITYTPGKTLSCLPWDGVKGGVLAFNVRDVLTLQKNIDVSGKGFKAGIGVNRPASDLFCGETNFFYPLAVQVLSNTKGTGIFNLINDKSFGKGAAANAGGGGNSHNAGGGGGGNAGASGTGGYQLETCIPAGFDNRGQGGKQLTYSAAANKLFMGGSGGAGHDNNTTGFVGNGGNGGGIIIMSAASITANGHAIISNGDSAISCGTTDAECHEGMGGGGAGGTIMTNIINYTDHLDVIANGGNGANMTAAGFSKVGPGGGGGGGAVFIKQAAIPSSVAITTAGGINGVCPAYANDPWGATSGATGTRILNATLAIDNIPFKKNIDSVRFNAIQTNCRAFNFNGLAFINTASVANWQWSFGDNTTAATQNASHTYNTGGTFPVKLVITDVNGCKDSITKNITTTIVAIDAGSDTAYCTNGNVIRTLHATGTGPYSWTPALYLDNPSAQHPVATISSTTKFYVTVTNSFGCSGTDSITIAVKPTPIVRSISDSAICAGSSLVLSTNGAATYNWSPAAYVNNASAQNPTYINTASQTLYVIGTAPNGCTGKDTVNITVKPLPVVKSIPDSLICNTAAITLTTIGAQSYSWSPAAGLNSSIVASPLFSGTHGSEVYYVAGTGANGCVGKDTIRITVSNPANLITPPNKEMCIKESAVLNGNNGNNVTYAWSPAISLSNAAIINPVASPSATQVYALTITDRICNQSTNFSVTVTVNPLPLVHASKANDITCSQTTALLNATGAATYLWTPAATLTGAATANPVARPIVNTLYTVTGTNAKGCKNTDTVTVLMKNSLFGFALPNTFTPNGDARNECFGVRQWGDISGLVFMIYNRFGQLVFQTNNPAVCWDGKYKGQPADQGSYVYYIKASSLCGEIVKKGSVLLLR